MPERSFNVGGWRLTGSVRVRSSWFFGLAVAEELWESIDGQQKWCRLRYSVSIREPSKKFDRIEGL